jgi:hypothetical protein
MNRTIRVAFILLLLFIFSPKSFLLGENQSAIRIITYPGDTCKTPPLTKWSEQEKWVWKQLCEGKPANLARYYGGSTNLEDFKGWQKKQKLSPEFLETILLYNPFLNELKNKRVEIKGAWFEKPLVLSDINLTNNIFLNSSRFDQRVSLYNLKSNHILSFDRSVFDKSLYLKAVQLQYLSLKHGKFKEVNLIAAKIEDISMNGSEFLGELNMDSIEVKKNLHMTGKAKFKKVILCGSNIGGQIGMDGSEFSGDLDMNIIVVGENLHMSNGAKFGKVNLGGANIGGQFSILDSDFSGDLDMHSIKVGDSLLMRNGSKFKSVDINGANIGGQIDMDGSEFSGDLNMESIKVGDSLFMRNGAKFNKVILIGSNIGKQIGMDGSEFSGDLDMNIIVVGESLHMSNGAKFGKVNLGGANIGGQFSILDSDFSGDLDMYSIKVGDSLLMRNGSKFKSVDINGANIGGQIDMDGSEFSGDLNMESIKVGDSLFMRNGAKFNKVILRGSNIGSLDISNSSFTFLKLTGTNINKELRYNSSKSNKFWPEKLEISGLTYNGIIDNGSYKPSIEGLKFFLERQTSYSPQPYKQLARVLQDTGQIKMANKILFMGKERERVEADFPYNIGLLLSKYFIGYGIGYGYFRILFWIAFFVRLGVGVLRNYGDDKNHHIKLGHAYSLDMLLPIIRLREKHYKIELSEPVTQYFYLHKGMGYLLAFFLIAGLSGITQ